MSRQFRGEHLPDWVLEPNYEHEIIPVGYVFQKSKVVPGPSESEQYQRLSLTMNGVLPRSREATDGLQPENFDGYQLIKPGQLIFKLIDLQNVSTSRVGLSEDLGLVSPAYIALTADRRVLPKYAYWYFMDLYNRRIFNNLSEGGVRANLSWEGLRQLPFILPSIERQHRIVEFLDAETARIDNARATVQKLTELADELKIATVDQLCFGELRARVDQIDSYLPYNPHRNTYLAIRSACGELPSGWRYLRFKNIARRTRNRNEDGNLEMLSLRQTGEVVYRSSTAQNQEPSEESIPKYLAVSPGNLVLNPMWLRGGAVGVSELRGAVSPDYRVFELSKEIDASYLGFILRSRPFIEQYKLLERAETTFDRRIQQVDLDNLPIPAPPLEIQKQIVRQIDEQFAADNVMRPTLTRVAELLTERRSALITAAVTSELEV